MLTSAPQVSFDPTLIKASAGSGKTHALTNRYLGLLGAGERPDKILATTFTRKAAHEIFVRILERLEDTCISGTPLDTGHGIIIDQQEAFRLLRLVVDSQHRVEVCTLDALFTRIFSCFALDLKLTESWTLRSPAETLRLQEELTQALASEVPVPELVAMLKAFSKGALGRSVRVPLERVVSDLLSHYEMDDSENAWCWLVTLAEKEQKQAPCAQELSQQIEALELPLTKAGKPDSRWKKAQADLITKLLDDDFVAAASSGVVKKVIEGADKFYSHLIDEKWCEVSNKVRVLARASLLQTLGESMRAGYQLARLASGHYREAIHRTGTLDFGEIKSVLLALWQRGLVPLEVQYRLDSSLQHMLLDEFQDTSLAEFRLLEPFIQNRLEMHAAGEQASFFCVGDVKQAIYGWRGGSASIFESLEERYHSYGLSSSSISQTRRCAPYVLELVNSVFKRIQNSAESIWGQNGAELAKNWLNWYEQHSTIEALHPDSGFVEVIDVPEQEEPEATSNAVEEAVVSTVHMIRAQCGEQATIAVLCRGNAAVSTYIRALRQGGYEVAEERGGALLDSPAVVALYQVLVLLDEPGTSAAAWHLRHVPSLQHLVCEGGVISPLQTLTQLRMKFYERGAAYTLAELIALLSPEVPERDQRRLQQLLVLARAFDESGSSRLKELMLQIENEKVEDPTRAGSLKVMTVHQSKGLGFDHVVLPDLDRELVSSRINSMWSAAESGSEGGQRYSLPVSKQICAVVPELEALKSATATRQANEEICVLYVALTRAKRSVHAVVRSGSKKANGQNSTIGVLLKESLSAASLADFSSDRISESHEYTRVQVGVFDQLLALPQKRESLDAVVTLRETEGHHYRGESASKHLKFTAITAAPLQDLTMDEVVERGLAERDSEEARQWGIDLHRELQKLKWLSDGTSLEETANAALSPVLVEALARGALKEVFNKKNFLDTEVLQAVALNEFPLQVSEEKGWKRGRVDRLVVGADREGKVTRLWIYDYKAASFSKTREEEAFELYKKQVSDYISVCASLFDLPAERCTGSLVFLGDGELVPVL